MSVRLILSLLLVAAATLAAAPVDRLEHRFALPDWSQDDPAGRGEFASSRAICAAVIDREPPTEDYPLMSQADDLEGCDSFALLHGLGGPANADAARHCAMVQRAEMGRAWQESERTPYAMFEGPGALAMFYANGTGVERDLDVALHMACEMNGAPFEMEYRVKALDTMRREGWSGDNFSVCSDVTSGRAAAQCTFADARLAQARRDERFAALAAGWPAEHRRLLAEARDGFADYARTANAMNNHGAGSGWPFVWQEGGAQAMIARYSDRLAAVLERRPLPVEAVQNETSETDEGFNRAATVTDAQWQALVEPVWEADRPLYDQHRAGSIAARRRFEPRLVAFFRLARPDLTAHEVRVLFRDL